VVGFHQPQRQTQEQEVGSKKAANKVAREVEARLAAGDMGLVKKRPPTLSEYGSKVLVSPLNGWADSTYSEYNAAFDLHIKPRFKGRRLDEIKRRHVKSMIAELRNDDLSASRVETIVQVLRNILKHAVDDEYIELNPCDKMG